MGPTHARFGSARKTKTRGERRGRARGGRRDKLWKTFVPRRAAGQPGVSIDDRVVKMMITAGWWGARTDLEDRRPQPPNRCASCTDEVLVAHTRRCSRGAPRAITVRDPAYPMVIGSRRGPARSSRLIVGTSSRRARPARTRRRSRGRSTLLHSAPRAVGDVHRFALARNVDESPKNCRAKKSRRGTPRRTSRPSPRRPQRRPTTGRARAWSNTSSPAAGSTT